MVPATPTLRPEVTPTGHLLSPAAGARVTRNIVASGTLAGVGEDQHVWLVVRDGNLLYPQVSEVAHPDQEWSLRFRHGGVTPVVSVELYVMGEVGHRFIVRRLRRGNFGGVPRIPGASLLDRSENVRVGR
jgi:hypothetical protein